MSIVRGASSILCPRSLGPNIAPEHALHVRLQNAAYEAAERDAEEELSEAADRQYSAVAHGRDDGTYGMRAYVESVTGIADGHGPVTVRAAWFCCQVCGLILPGEYRAISGQNKDNW